MDLSVKSPPRPSGPETFKLHGYYLAVVATSFLTLLALAFFINGFPDYFPWIRYRQFLVFSLLGLAGSQGVLFILQSIFKKKILFTFDRYAFIVFFFLALYATGGAESPFTFILIFPLLVSVVDLNARATKQVGVIITAALALLIFADPPYWHDADLIAKHAIRVLLYGLVAFYLHRIVKETLRQKFEKEETARRFVELAELDKLKTDFVAVASHQLRTPLSGIRWGLENILNEGLVKAEAVPMVEEIEQRAGAAIGIVNEMLNTAEQGLAALREETRPINLTDLLKNALSDLAYDIKHKKVKVETALAGPCLVRGDQKSLKAALTNILDNAVRYAPGGTVSLKLSPHGSQALAVIKDTGIGIAPEDLPYVSERFYRGKNASALEPNESGVGLYIAKKIIERHGGSVSIESAIGAGTTVTVKLPLMKKQ